MAAHKPWNDAEREHLKAHYPAISAKDLTQLITDRTAQAIVDQAKRMGIKKCHERLREMGRTNVSKRWGERRLEA